MLRILFFWSPPEITNNHPEPTRNMCKKNFLAPLAPHMFGSHIAKEEGQPRPPSDPPPSPPPLF